MANPLSPRVRNIRPSATLAIHELSDALIREGRTVLGIANAAVSVDGEQIYVAEDVKVGLFTSLDDF